MKDKDVNWSESFWYRDGLKDTYTPREKKPDVIIKKTWDIEDAKKWFRELKRRMLWS